MDTGAVALIITLIVVIVGGGILREYIKGSKASKEAFGKEMRDMKLRMTQLEADMKEMKELVADTIIREA